MSNIEKRLEAAIRMGADEGDATERSIFRSQVVEGIAKINLLTRQLAAATERAEKAERERDEAQAACAAMTAFIDAVQDAAVTNECSDIGRVTRIRLAGEKHLPWWGRRDNPGKPIIDELAQAETENADLRAVIEPLACDDMVVACATEDGTWRWATEDDMDSDCLYRWHGNFNTPADAALAGLAEMRKDKTDG